MKTHFLFALPALASACALLALATPARAATVTNGPTAPAIGPDDIANYGTVSGTDKWFYENSAAGAAKGQTFITGNAAILLKSITYQIAGTAAPTKTYAIRVGTVAGSTPTFTQIVRETATQSAAWANGNYATWTFSTPVLLQANTTYGIDVGMIGSTSSWSTGIPYINVTDNVYTGGALYNSGTSGTGTTAMSIVTSDRLFHLDLEKPITTNFTLVATSPADGATNALATNPLLATFSRYLTAGTGNIILKNLSDSVDTVIPIGDPRIAIFENTLTINPGSALQYGKNYAVRIETGALISDTAIPFAGIADDTTWNFSTPAGDPLLDAIAALKSHILGTIPLNAAQIEAHKLTMDAEKGRFAISSAAIAAAFDLVTTYDTELGALFVARGLPAREYVTNDLHWAIFTVMQNLMDLTYSAANITNFENLLNGYKFGSSASFPGSCTPPADPNLIHTASISASYLNTVGRATQGDGPGTFARKPTGCYLAPGSIATVTVPAALVGTGYQIRVGAHSWDHYNRPYIKRLDRATLVYPITSATTKIANPLGGGIYIEVPFRANAGVVNVQIANAVRSPFFSVKSFHTTTPAQWLTERAHPAPWADFQTEKFMMQVPTNWISAMPDPTQLMADWDTAMDAVNDLMGFPRIRGKESFYTQVDMQLRAAVFAPGYPSCNVGGFNANGNYGGYANHYLVRGPQVGGGADIEFHEQGHGYFFPKFGGESESNVNLLYVPAMQALGKTLDVAFRMSLGSGNTYQTLDTTAIAWMCTFNFSPKEQPMAQLEKQYQFKGHAKFVEIARLYGWTGLNAYWSSFTQDEENGITSPTSTDGLILRLCQSVGKDVRPLLHFWGIHPQNPTALRNSIVAANIPADTAIKDRLLYYKTIVPANNAEFRTFATSWWGRKPLISGAWEETDHAMQWDEIPDADGGSANANVRPNGDIYVEATATDIRNRVDELVEIYFPNVLGPNPMSFAIAPTAMNATTVSMTATTATAPVETVQYYFENTTDPLTNNSGWTTEKSWTNTGLTTGQAYSFRVKARDGNLAETAWSTLASATPEADNTPPAPNPMSFASPPDAVDISSIIMTANVASDINGVEYYFACTAGGGPDSDWQSSPEFTATELVPGNQYTYVVRARDSYLNTTTDSAPASATTPVPDTTGPLLSNQSPSHLATNVVIGSNLVLAFDENIALGSGNVTLRNLTDGSGGDIVIAITDATQISVSGSTLTINPTANLLDRRNYAVQIDATAIDDLSGNSFTGIADDTTWTFATEILPYVWTQTAGGAQAWITGTNWISGSAPIPVSGDTIDFSTVNLAADTTLTLGADRTARLWKFGDTSGAQNWTVNSGSQIILAGTTPTIEVKQNTTTLSSLVAGTSGLTKTGAGLLTLTNGSNNYTGGTFINAGTLTPAAGALGTSANTITFTGNAELRPVYNSNPNFTQGIVINPGVTAHLNAVNQFYNHTVSGVVSGSGALLIGGTDNSNGNVTLSNTGNSHTGNIRIGYLDNSRVGSSGTQDPSE